jgi:murein DD-endopeptidase MepM/ murein hydrolase activator NlpD
LSEITVEVGAIVSSSDVIGHTGQSGLAFGDHLHFGTYLQGVPFDSSEVWDNKYFRQKILTIYNNFIQKNSAKGISDSVKKKNYKK